MYSQYTACGIFWHFQAWWLSRHDTCSCLVCDFRWTTLVLSMLYCASTYSSAQVFQNMTLTLCTWFPVSACVLDMHGDLPLPEIAKDCYSISQRAITMTWSISAIAKLLVISFTHKQGDQCCKHTNCLGLAIVDDCQGDRSFQKCVWCLNTGGTS